MIGAPGFLNPNPGTSDDSVFLMQPTPTGQVKMQPPPPQLPRKEPEMKCLLCAGSWHPVSACVLYQTIFTCPLCREEPHPIKECNLYPEWAQIKETISQREDLKSEEPRRDNQTRRDSWSRRPDTHRNWQQGGNTYDYINRHTQRADRQKNIYRGTARKRR